MNIIKVEGKNKGEIMIYALSTCGWCSKTKEFLKNLGVEFQYVDVDLLFGSDREKTLEEIKKWNPYSSFPTLVINQKDCVVGFDQEKIKQALGI